MNLAALKSDYEARSLKAGDIVRQLDLAGIALIWIFKTGTGSILDVDPKLLKAAFLIFASLSFDLTQYLAGSLLLFCYFRFKERQGTTDEDEFDLPAWLPVPMWTCFWAKSVLAFVAYLGYLLPFLANRFQIIQMIHS